MSRRIARKPKLKNNVTVRFLDEKLHKFTIIRLIEAGKLEAIRLKPGGQYRISEEALQRCRERLTIKATAFGKQTYTMPASRSPPS